MAHYDRRAQSPVIDHLLEIGQVVQRAIGPFGGPLALPMAALIERERMESIDERGRDEIPPMSVRRSAMQKQDRRLALAAVIEAVEHQAIDLELALVHREPDA